MQVGEAPDGSARSASDLAAKRQQVANLLKEIGEENMASQVQQIKKDEPAKAKDTVSGIREAE
eukprot:9826838-Alexandrium_andersonii.AAC.1